MRIVRDDSIWLVLFPDGRPKQCLKGLAVRCGYRVGELSDALGHSKRYVHEVFERDVGVPPKLWLRKERMEMALSLLSEGIRPDEVGERVGFSQGSGFRRAFRLMHGISPGGYVRCSSRLGAEEDYPAGSNFGNFTPRQATHGSANSNRAAP